MLFPFAQRWEEEAGFGEEEDLASIVKSTFKREGGRRRAYIFSNSKIGNVPFWFKPSFTTKGEGEGFLLLSHVCGSMAAASDLPVSRFF